MGLMPASRHEGNGARDGVGVHIALHDLLQTFEARIGESDGRRLGGGQPLGPARRRRQSKQESSSLPRHFAARGIGLSSILMDCRP